MAKLRQRTSHRCLYRIGYNTHMSKELFWLHGEIRTPPFTSEARIEAGTLLRRLQEGDTLSMPFSRPLPIIGSRVHELRVRDADINWRIIYRVDPQEILIAEVFEKKTEETPRRVIDVCRARLSQYDSL
jgi:phage-related protein